jgi:hypothetical protein
MNIISIDPGSNGGLALYRLGELSIHKRLPNMTITNNVIKLHEELLGWELGLAVIEEQIGRSGNKGKGASPWQRNSPKSIFTQGFNYGRIITLLQLCNLEVIEIPPLTWQCKMPKLDPHEDILNSPKKPLETKYNSITWAIALGANIRGPQGGWMDGVADAVCIGKVYIEGKLGKEYYRDRIAS